MEENIIGKYLYGSSSVSNGDLKQVPIFFANKTTPLVEAEMLNELKGGFLMLRKLIEKILFKKKEDYHADYADRIVFHVRALTRLDIETNKLLDKLKSVPDSSEFDTVLGNIDQMKWHLKTTRAYLDIYPSLQNYIAEMDEQIKGYEKTAMLLCYGAKFK